nr:sensor histidine kinase [Micromonospora sp. DSM 115978]
MTGTARPLPPEIDLAAYRVVQESITNVVRHAGPARVHVTLDYQPRQLTIDVVDAPSTEPASTATLASGPPGHGLAGLSARVTELAGSFSAGPTPAGGGWRVHAELPVPAAGRPADRQPHESLPPQPQPHP